MAGGITNVRRDIRAWLLSGVTLALSERLLYEHFWLVGLLPIAAWVFAGVLLSAIHLFRLPAVAERYKRRWNLAALAGGFLFLLPMWGLGASLVQYGRFRWNRAEYDRVARAAAEGPTESTRLLYDVDPGPPVRVAFPWPGGITDNWCGVVHDPTGDVLQVNTMELWTPQWRNHRVTLLFGGDMVSCEHVDGPYHYCCFT
jgi:hypothetical protein